MTPKGIRNNNPTNLEHTPKNPWQGLDKPPSDGRFCRFTDMAFGIRAAALNLIAYQDRHGLDTIRELVTRWAPHSENNVEAYVQTVCKVSGFLERQRLDLHDYADIKPVLKGMIRQEVGAEGAKAVTDAQIDEGLRRAGIVPPAAPVAKDAAVTATGAVATLGLVAQAVAQIEAIWTGLQSIHPSVPHIAVGIAGVAAVGVFVYVVANKVAGRRQGIA